ncbi:MAG: restriction endonuclease subunit S [Candidatus Moraniibacteriota bacterium]
MSFSIIQKSQLEGATRMDAEYYQPEFLEMKRLLVQQKNTVPLFELAEIKTGPAYASDKIGEKFEIPLARIGDVTNKNEIENWLTLSSDEFEKFNSKKINNGDILMTMTGDPPDVGKVNFISNSSKKVLAFNQRVAKLHPKANKISGKYLFAYLSNEFSRLQVERTALGIRQRNLGMNDLRNILVFVPYNAKNIEILVDGHLRELENSKLLYQQAESLLLSELGLAGFDNDEQLWTVVNFSEIEIAERMDAEYFQPKYKIIEDRVAKYNVQKLGDLVSMKKGIEVGAEEYQEEGKVFIRVSSMTKFGIVESDQKCLSEKLYEKLKADFQPKKGEILLTKDATPGIVYVLKEDIRGIVSGGNLRLQLKDKKVEAEYLALCLNSIIGQMQAERDAGGSVIAHWKPEQIKNVLIPVLPIETQKKISELLITAHESRKKSKELLEEAKRKVEEMIEKGGDEV